MKMPVPDLQTFRPVMVELAGLEAFYGRFLDKNGVCW